MLINSLFLFDFLLKFNLSDEKQLKECWNYKNLQPLWWWENLEKGNKYNE